MRRNNANNANNANLPNLPNLPNLANLTRMQGFTLIDTIITMAVLAFVLSTMFAFYQSTQTIEDPVQRLQNDKQLQFAVENILADYYNNFWRSWDESPPEGKDVCDPSMIYYSRTDVLNMTELSSPLTDFQTQVQDNIADYGNVTLLGITCGPLRAGDPVDLQQLRIFLENPANALEQTITIGK